MNMELAWCRASSMHAAVEVDTMARVALGSAFGEAACMGVELAYTKNQSASAAPATRGFNPYLEHVRA